MKHWFQSKIKSEFIQKQIYMMSSLGLFYIIIIALFAVPLMGTFVVVLIKGVLDFRYLILGSGIIGLSLIIFYGGKFIFRACHRVKKDGIIALQDANKQAVRTGEPVQIGLFNGLVTFSYGRGYNKSICSQDQIYLLPDSQEIPKTATFDIIQKIKDLSEMKKQGIIDEDEFQKLKHNLIQESPHQKNQTADKL